LFDQETGACEKTLGSIPIIDQETGACEKGQYQILRPMDLSIATVPCQMDGLPKVTCLGLPNQNLNLFKV